MTGEENQFLSLDAYKGCMMTFGDNKRGEIIGIGKVGKSKSLCVDKVLLVKGLKHNLISISQLCDRGNIVEFHASVCRILDGKTRELILEGKRVKDVYMTNLCSLSGQTLSCMSVHKNDPWLWHKRLGHVNARTLNTLKKLDLVDGMPNMKFEFKSLCDDCVKGKQVKSSFKSKNCVSTSRILELVHIDLCGPMRIISKGGSRYICVIVDDFSRYVWLLFLSSKDQAFDEFLIWLKMVQNKFGLIG